MPKSPLCSIAPGGLTLRAGDEVRISADDVCKAAERGGFLRLVALEQATASGRGAARTLERLEDTQDQAQLLKTETLKQGRCLRAQRLDFAVPFGTRDKRGQGDSQSLGDGIE